MGTVHSWQWFTVRTGMRAGAALCLVTLAALSGCAVNPSTGRSQLIAIPSAQIAHADTGFTLATAAQGLVTSARCALTKDNDSADGASEETTAKTGGIDLLPRCPSTNQLERFNLQVQRLGAELAVAAQNLDPALNGRIGEFHISVVSIPGTGVGSASSAGGRIYLSSSLAATDPTDDVVAFLLAREMGHVIARHGEEDSGARIAFTAITTVIPLGGLIMRFAASILGSQALKASWADAQHSEADTLALALLERCDRPPGTIALNLRVGLNYARLPAGEWAAQLAASTDRVTAMAGKPLVATLSAATHLVATSIVTSSPAATNAVTANPVNPNPANARLATAHLTTAQLTTARLAVSP